MAKNVNNQQKWLILSIKLEEIQRYYNTQKAENHIKWYTVQDN